MDDLAGHHDWTGQTIVHPLGLFILLILGMMTLTVRRQYAVLPMIVMACFVASAQRIAVGPLDFNFLRILVLVGWCRVLLHAETKGFVWRPIDYALILWACSGTLVYTMHHGTTDALINRLGWSFDSVGMYFLFRMLVRDWKDVQTILLGITVISLPVLAFFLIEYSTARNPFSIFGGVPQITNERDGRLRCQGPFSHPLMAGSFWAALIPLIGVQWWYAPRRRSLALAAVAASVMIVILSASSGPVAAAAFAVIASAAYFVRHKMFEFRWLLVFTLIALHFIMTQPVWHLLTRINIVGGSTGWHRFMLYDQFIHRFDEWWLLGTASTRHWGRGLQDITSQYVLEGVRGGSLTLIVFILVIALAYREVGRLWRMQENAGLQYRTYLAWALGASLFVHTISFISVSYFGQIIVLWFLLLATITSLTVHSKAAGLSLKTNARRKPAGRQARAASPAPKPALSVHSKAQP